MEHLQRVFGTFNRAIATVCAVSLPLIALFLALNVGAYLDINYYEEQLFAAGVGCAMFVAYLRYATRPDDAGAFKNLFYGYGYPLLAWASLVICLAFAWRFEDYSTAVALRPTEVVVGGLMMLLALSEIVRRIAGLPLVVIVMGILAYGLWGSGLPERYAAPSVAWDYMITYVTTDPAALLGMPVAVAIVVVLPFLFMGGLLAKSGGGQFFTDVCLAAFKKSPGGPAKVAVVSSALLGTVSGSAVANVATSGVITIPMMKKSGYSAERASSIEAVASTGGQFVPPVMGAAAFLMAEFLQIPYADIAAAAILPTVLFFSILYFNIHLSARKEGLKPATETGEPAKSVWTYLRSGWHAGAGLLLLFFLLLALRWRPELSAFVAAVFYGACGMAFGYLGKKLPFREVLDNFRTTGTIASEVIIVSMAAGIVIGVLNFSGLTLSLSRFLLYLSFDITALLIIYTAVGAIVLGMGMPTTGVYVLLAVLMAPALVQTGLDPLASHFFIFYFGVLSMVTPPVALAAFAAAGIGGARPMATSVECVKFGWPIFVLPFMMIADPSLLLVNTGSEALAMFIKELVLFVALAAGFIGYWCGLLSKAARGFLVVASATVLICSFLQMPTHYLEWALVTMLACILALRFIKRPRVSLAAGFQ